MGILLKQLDYTNWEECANLSVHDDQKKYLAQNVYSIAESRYSHPDYDFEPLAIYNQDSMVGFAMWDQLPLGDTGIYFIFRFMIDKRYQRKGYGKKAMDELIKRIKQRPDSKIISLSIKPENSSAEKFYVSLGFRRSGDMHKGEAIMHLHLNS